MPFALYLCVSRVANSQMWMWKKGGNAEQTKYAAHVKKFVSLQNKLNFLVQTATTARELYGIGGDNAASEFEYLASRFVHFWRAWPHQHLLWADLFRIPLFASQKEEKWRVNQAKNIINSLVLLALRIKSSLLFLNNTIESQNEYRIDGFLSFFSLAL